MEIKSVIGKAITVVILVTAFQFKAYAQFIDLDRIAVIESSNNPKAFNISEGARGLCQIRPEVLQEYNHYNPRNKYSPKDLFNKSINLRVASWYFEVRIPQMLRYFKQPVTVTNIIVAYNSGIKSVIENRKPRLTKRYLRKYYGKRPHVHSGIL